jgi:alpha-L-fucosidase
MALLPLFAKGSSLDGLAQTSLPSASPEKMGSTEARQNVTREERMRWWHKARFGMFVHLGIYSATARKEWVMYEEGIPTADYELFVDWYNPMPGAPREWARLARQAGMNYIVFTAKHHEGFCNFDTKLTQYTSVVLGPKRDLVREYVEAARAEGLRVGIYYSLMDWHHPDGYTCASDSSARRRFVDYTHGLIRELLTNYGKIDILWYDMPIPLDRAGWESDRMNEIVFSLQPEIVVNNRNQMPGDFATPEQTIGDNATGRAWESCMTLNESWGFQQADDNWKSAKTIVRNLIDCAADGGNYLVNIGPRADGSIPTPSRQILSEVGFWLQRNRESVFETDPCAVESTTYASFTQKGNLLYMHVFFWPGEHVGFGGLVTKVKSARLLATGQPVDVEQTHLNVRLTGLPSEPPEWPVTTFVLECERAPKQDSAIVNRDRLRPHV